MPDPFEWYPWYVLRWQTDQRVRLLDTEERGAYHELLDECWLEGSIPSDPDLIARLLPPLGRPIADLWGSLAHFFVAVDGDPTRLVNPTLESIREQQRAKHLERKRTGAMGAEARWGKKSDGSAMANPMPTQSVANGSKNKKKTKRTKRTNPVPPVTWLTKPIDIWKEHIGGDLIPVGARGGNETGKVLRGVVLSIAKEMGVEVRPGEKVTAEVIRPAVIEMHDRLGRYCKDTEPRFATVHKFARTHGAYRRLQGPGGTHPFVKA